MTKCPDEDLQSVIALAARNDDEGAIALIDQLFRRYEDARLLFLKGSILAGMQRYDEGRREMHAALALSPTYDLARFQLGFLEFTSGFPEEAARIWAPFGDKGEGDAFRQLSAGLNSLGEDRWQEAEARLTLGMSLNVDHPLINNDMQLILDEMRARIAPGDASDRSDASISPVDQLLRQAALRASPDETRH